MDRSVYVACMLYPWMLGRILHRFGVTAAYRSKNRKNRPFTLRQLSRMAVSQPFCFAVVVEIFFSFFAAQSPRSFGRSSPNFATCSILIQIYKIRPEIWRPSLEKKTLAAPKH